MNLPSMESEKPKSGPSRSGAAGGGVTASASSSMLGLVVVLLQRWRLIVVLGLTGAVLGGLLGLLSQRTYTSRASFLPQGSSELGGAGSLGLALAASQFGIRMPGSSGAWSPPVYVDLVRSRDLLAPIVTDTFALPDGGRGTLIELLEVEDGTPEERLERAVRLLANHVQSREVRGRGAVEVLVTTKWPTVSLAVAEQLVEGVHRFNLEARSTQSAAERAFVEPLVDEARLRLRTAEDRLQTFLQRNRLIGDSPELVFERERLERDVAMQQDLLGSMLQAYEEARMGESRNTPVITVLQQPRLAVIPNPRRTVLKAAVGGLGGGLLGLFLALLIHGIVRARESGSPEAVRFFELIDRSLPAPVRRRIARIS